MRARVRTFHSIPSLQAKQGPSAYKQLQDGPRLKSILKGCQEDYPQPITITELVSTPRPRINPVSLVFLLAQFAPKVTDNHFRVGFDFFELFNRNTLSSASRAQVFLWLCWWYLESDFTADDCLNNPYGAGRPGSDPKNNARVPDPEVISETQAKAENEDPDYEVEFGLQKKKEREEILASGDPPSASGKRAVKGKDTDADRLANLPLETSTETPIFDQTPSDQPRSEYLDPPPHNPQDHQTPVLAPAPPSGFTAANAAPSSATRKRSRSASPAQPRSLKLPKLRPNLSQQSGESVSSTRTPAEQNLQPQPPMQHPGYDHNASPYHAYPPQALDEQADERLPYHDTAAASRHPAYPPSSHTPAAVPSPAQYYQQHYPLAGSPYGSGYPYQATPALHAPDVEIVPPPHPTPTYNTRSQNAHHMQPHAATDAEHSRLEKVGNLVDSNMAALRRAKLKERRKRGVVTDAWIKARSLPGGWDSEEDEFGRLGGLDEVRDQDGGGLAVNISVGPGSNETNRWHIGDAGTQAHELAFACSKLSMTLKMLSQRRTKPKSSKKRKARDEQEDAGGGQDGRRVSRRTSGFPAPPESSQLHYGHPASYLSPAARPHHHHSHEPRPHHHHVINRPHHHHSHIDLTQPHPNDMATSSFPRPPTPPDRAFRRPSSSLHQQSYAQPQLRGGQSDAPLSPQDHDSAPASATADKTFNWTPKGRKRKDSDTHAPGTRPGEIGVPLGKFLEGEGAKVVVDPSTSPAGGVGRRRRSTLGSARGVEDDGVGGGSGRLRRESRDVEMEG